MASSSTARKPSTDRPRRRLVRRTIQLALAFSAASLLAASSIQCSGAGDAGDSGAGGAGASGSGNPTGSNAGGSVYFDANTKDYSAERFYEDDPPPMGCDGGGQPPVPGGTPECPDDKNLPGCPCVTK